MDTSPEPRAPPSGRSTRGGDRHYCGIDLPDGLVKNQELPTNYLTPAVKAEDHDRPISPNEIVSENWMTADDWEHCSRIAQELFAFGQARAAEHGWFSSIPNMRWAVTRTVRFF